MRVQFDPPAMGISTIPLPTTATADSIVPQGSVTKRCACLDLRSGPRSVANVHQSSIFLCNAAEPWEDAELYTAPVRLASLQHVPLRPSRIAAGEDGCIRGSFIPNRRVQPHSFASYPHRRAPSRFGRPRNHMPISTSTLVLRAHKAALAKRASRIRDRMIAVCLRHGHATVI
ncbi:hypothetical protein ONZ51_g3217 [Trametes cubensis]|uniref:Uncharacterized protein n=1 Tax=Trametes cubensis TaxID=1111947 RepID=A0AAD7U0N8_9APHY|nr:hypothetical protein ONZ51_g3217 [Trametes cubensis]